MAYIDVKHTIWRRYNIPEESDVNKIKKILSDSGIFDPYDNLVERGYDITIDDLHDTQEYYPPDENQAPTVELYDDDNECIFQNWDNY